MPCLPHRRCPLGRILILGLFASLAGAPAAHGQAMYDATISASVTIDTAASPTFTITTIPPTETFTLSTLATPPATANASLTASINTTAPTISDTIHVTGEATGADSQSATSSNKGSISETLTVKNLSTDNFVYQATHSDSISLTDSTTRPGESVSFSLSISLLRNGSSPTGNSFTLAGGASDVWTINKMFSITAFSPAPVPEPGSLALLFGFGLTGVGLLRRRKK